MRVKEPWALYLVKDGFDRHEACKLALEDAVEDWSKAWVGNGSLACQ